MQRMIPSCENRILNNSRECDVDDRNIYDYMNDVMLTGGIKYISSVCLNKGVLHTKGKMKVKQNNWTDIA